MEPQQDHQGIFAEARWSDSSNTASTEWQEGGAVRAGAAIGVKHTVEVV